MIKIQKTTDCCGCSACAEICPKQCISLDVDYEGFWYPQINSSICIDCHLCESVCPVLNPGVEHKPLHVYAAINKNDEIRARSASGGVYLRLLQKKLLTREELYLVLNLIEIGMLFLDILKQKKDWKSFAVLNMSKLGWERAIEKLNAS